MIYKITITDPAAHCSFHNIYAHPDWDHPTTKEGDVFKDYKVIFVAEISSGVATLSPVVFKWSFDTNVYTQIKVGSGIGPDLDLKSPYISAVKKLSIETEL